MRLSWLTLIFLLSIAARADVTNRQILPIGERQPFLGNTGTGNPRDTGAVYFNPGALAHLEGDRVSVLGSAYLSYSRRTDAMAFLDGSNIPYESKGFTPVPITFVAAKRLGDWALAFSALMPDANRSENRATFETTQTRGSLIDSQNFEDLWLGFSASHKVSESFGLGLTLFFIRHSESQLVQAIIDNRTSGAFSSVTNRVQLSAWGASLVAGIFFAPNEMWKLGLRVQSPFVQITGSADVYSATRSSASAATTTEAADATANYRLPLDATLGVSFEPARWVELLLDISLQLGTDYETLPGSSLSSRYDTILMPRGNVGVEFRVTEHIPLRFGFFMSPSAIRELSSTNGFQYKENFLGVTAGIGLRTEHVQTSVGVFYLWSNGENVPVGNPSGKADLLSRALGGLLTTAYVF